MYNSITPADIMHLPLHGENALKIVADGRLTTIYTMDIANQSIKAKNTPFLQDLDIKALLRPLSDLEKPITYLGQIIIPLHYVIPSFPDKVTSENKGLLNMFIKGIQCGGVPYNMLQRSWELHFDTTGLIEAGKALNLNAYQNGK